MSIKKELIEKGHKFISGTDTEVIVHGYEEWGQKVLKRLRGMFAFGIWDENRQELFLARDRLGIKPLYYYYQPSDNKFIFASELKAIIQDNTINREINPESLKYYLKYTYIPAPYSIWKNIYKLPSAHYLILKGHEITIEEYWKVRKLNSKKFEKNYFIKIEQILKKAIAYRFVSDVPVGVLLSGGLDSSMVTAISSEIKEDLLSFSIGFDLKEYSELRYARIVANKFKTNSIENILDLAKLRELLDPILFYYDEPIGVSSIFPTFLLMQTVSKHVKVALSGDGGDEVFAGYIWYNKYLKKSKYNFLIPIFKLLNSLVSKLFPIPNNKYLKFLNKKIAFLSLNNFDKYRKLTTPRFEDKEIEHLFQDNFKKFIKNEDIIINHANSGLNDIKDLQIFDMKTFLVDSILVKVDRASMAHSLEIRVPLLDHYLIEYVMSLRKNLIFRNYEKKHLLKKIAKKFLPNEIIYRNKKGFSAPIEDLGFIDENIHVLNDSVAVADNIFNADFIRKLIQKKKIDYNNAKIWLLILFELWYRKWKQ